MRLVCPRCDAALVPTLSGLRCPRLSACGRGGIIESLATPPVFVLDHHASTGVEA